MPRCHIIVQVYGKIDHASIKMLIEIPKVHGQGRFSSAAMRRRYPPTMDALNAMFHLGTVKYYTLACKTITFDAPCGQIVAVLL